MNSYTTRQKVFAGVVAIAGGITAISGAYIVIKDANPFMLKEDHNDSMEDLDASLGKILEALDSLHQGVCRNTLQRISALAAAAQLNKEIAENRNPPDYDVVRSLRQSHTNFLEQYSFERLECGFVSVATPN